MLRFIWAQLRGRPRRTLALLAGVLVATTGFTALSAGAAVQQLRVDGTVADNYRAAYDILVRPKGSRTALEEDRGLVAPNHLSGLYGGITRAQVDQVRGVGNVGVAAPVAMLGYTYVELRQTVDLTDQVDPTAEKQLFRLTPRWLADRGLTVLDDAPQYVYLTRNEIIPGMVTPGSFKDGTQQPELPNCSASLEAEPNGRKQQICLWGWSDPSYDGTTTRERTTLTALQLTRDGRFITPSQFETPVPSDRLTVEVRWQVAVLVAAIDPVAEARLVDLDDAVVAGRYLTEDDRPGKQMNPGEETDLVDLSYQGIPALVASSPYVDEQLEISVERLGSAPAAGLAGKSWPDVVAGLAGALGSPGDTPTRSGRPVFGGADEHAVVGQLYQPGPVGYRTDADGVLHPEVVPPDRAAWKVDGWVAQPPRVALEDGFRPMHRAGGTTSGRPPEIGRVGMFDPAKLRGFSPLSGVPMETYQAPSAVGADARTRDLLGGEPLLPNSNPAGYLTAPPLVLTNLDSMRYVSPMAAKTDPISAVRVRVDGVTGLDVRSRELVRSTAEKIAMATGLDVDITIGASPEPQTVELPAVGDRPALTLSEGWSQKGVAVAIVEAADRKSLLLFGLILLVCTLFLGNAVTAAVRDRRRELAVLTCLGWPARRLAALVFAEVTAVGLVAGVLAGGAALALPGVPLSHAALAVPVALGVSMLAAAPPALSAARARPWSAVQPAVARVRRTRRRTTVVGLALANLWRVPGRTALGVGALGVGVGALTMLVVVVLAFRNDVVGTLLGDAVAVRVRAVDVLAAVTAVVIGVLMVADVLYINVRERAAELAALWAAGWSNRALLRLVGYEGLGMGVLGGLLGAGAGLLGVTWFVGQLSLGMVLVAVGVAAAAVVVASVAAVVPVLVLRRLPLSTLLAEE